MAELDSSVPWCRLSFESSNDETNAGETGPQPKDEPAESARKTVQARTTKEVELTQFPAVLGRAKDSQFLIPLDELSTSRQHARIEFAAGRFEIVDLQSRNGTFVNEKMISRQVLRSGDKIKLGSFEMTFTSRETPAATAPISEESVNVAASIDLRGLGNSMRDPTPVTAPLAAEQSIMGQSLRLPITWGISIFEKVTEALLTSPTLKDICEKILNGASQALPCERSLLMLRNPATGQLEIQAKWSKRGDAETIRMSQVVVKRVLEQKQSLLIDDAATDYFNSESLMAAKVMSGMCAPLIRDDQVLGLIYVDSQRRKAFRTEHLELLTGLALLVAVALQQDQLKREMEEQRKLKEWYERYGGAPPLNITPDAAAAGLNHMLAQSREVSVLFADLSGFTSMSESRDPESIVQILNTIFEHFTQAVFDHSGMLDKFLGDGLMAVFGVPLYRSETTDESEHAARAIRAALSMQCALDDYNAAHATIAPLRLRVGINSGGVLLGDIGSVKRKDYTVIGDTVNVASRLESSVAQPGQVVVGPRTKQLAESHFLFQELPPAKVKGKAELITAYAVDRAAYLMKQSGA